MVAKRPVNPIVAVVVPLKYASLVVADVVVVVADKSRMRSKVVAIVASAVVVLLCLCNLCRSHPKRAIKHVTSRGQAGGITRSAHTSHRQNLQSNNKQND